jgi:hypothetical protein
MTRRLRRCKFFLVLHQHNSLMLTIDIGRGTSWAAWAAWAAPVVPAVPAVVVLAASNDHRDDESNDD